MNMNCTKSWSGCAQLLSQHSHDPRLHLARTHTYSLLVPNMTCYMLHVTCACACACACTCCCACHVHAHVLFLPIACYCICAVCLYLPLLLSML